MVGIGRRPFWLDEGLSIGATNQLATVLPWGNVMPAYYLLLAPWSMVSLDPGWLRVLSAVLALLTLPIVYRFGERVGGVATARLATGLTAASWFFVRFGQEARGYTFTLLMASLSWWALVRWVEAGEDADERRRWRRIFAFAAIGALFTHGMVGLQFVAQVGTLLVLDDRRDRLRELGPTMIGWFATLAALLTLGAGNQATFIQPLSVTQLHDLVAAFTGPSWVEQVGLGSLIIAGAAIVAAGWRRSEGSPDAWLHLVVAAWALGPPLLLVGISTLRPYLLPRYVIGSVPGVVLLMTIAIGRLQARRALWVAVIGAVIALHVPIRMAIAHEEFDDWRRAAAAVAEGEHPGDVVVFPTPWLRSPFDHAWSNLHQPPVGPEAIYPTDPIGEPHFVYATPSEVGVLDFLREHRPKRMWVVGDTTVSQGETVEPFLTQPVVSDYRVAHRWLFEGDVKVVLLTFP